MGGKIPEWESELWSYVSSSDGEHCPLYSHCQARQSGKWCVDENIERVKPLLEKCRLNLSDCAFIKPVSTCRVFQLVEMLAQAWQLRGRVRCPPVPTGLVSLADEQHPIEVRVLPLKAYHGAIWGLREGWVIQIKKNAPSAANRFTIFHEAFHILAHCKATPVFRRRGTVRGSFNELLADYFAICVLMPKEWVKEKWTEFHDLNKMAKLFDVPKPAMCVSLKRLGLI